MLNPKADDDLCPQTIEQFNLKSGSFFERLLFNNRQFFIVICFILTAFFAFKAFDVRVNADYNDMIPTKQVYIANYLRHYNDMQAQANAVRIAVVANNGTIINKNYLKILAKINDEVYLLPGVDRPFMSSLWTSNTRWTSVTPQGINSGPVISGDYDGSAAQLAILQRNIINTGKVGTLVTPDFKASMIYVPLLEINNITGKPLNYGKLARQLNALRKAYDSQGVTIHIIGFAMVVGDMINAITKVLVFFAVSIIIATIMLFWYTRCVRSTMLVVIASLVAVTWQMGLLTLLGFDLTPYSVLVPFLVFAIGMSHGAQKMNGVMQDIGRGSHPLVAARYTFRRLFLAGFAALVCDMTSFAALLTIRITAIQQLAIIASLGVAVLIITNLMMVPVMLSYIGVSKKAAHRSLINAPGKGVVVIKHPLWAFLDLFTHRRFATVAVVMMVLIGGIGWYFGRSVQVGDLSVGAPELRQDSVYNRDNAYIIKNFMSGNDSFIIMADTPPNGCMNYQLLGRMEQLQWKLQQLSVVQSTNSVATFASNAAMLLTEGAPKWYGLEPNQAFLDEMDPYIPADLANFGCSFDSVYISLTDHKAATLTSVLKLSKDFIDAKANQSPNFKLSLVGGNAGIEAATNIVIEQANRTMLFLVYAVVIVFCLIAFRSWRAVLCAVLPLVVTSLLAQALMAWLGIGIKVATLPVVALGVGIGVDYALYVLSVILRHMRAGETLSSAYYRTLLFTGRVVILTGITLSAGVVTWIFAPIKFQADMGLLLSFMFLWNMLGAMIFLPALAYFLLPEKIFKAKEQHPR